MDPNLQEQYDNYFELFRTKGWKQFIEDLEEVFKSFHIEDIKDTEELFRIKGERKVLNQILGFESAIIANYDMLLQEDNDVETV